MVEIQSFIDKWEKERDFADNAAVRNSKDIFITEIGRKTQELIVEQYKIRRDVIEEMLSSLKDSLKGC